MNKHRIREVKCLVSDHKDNGLSWAVNSEMFLFQGAICRLEYEGEIPILLPTGLHSKRNLGSKLSMKVSICVTKAPELQVSSEWLKGEKQLNKPPETQKYK